MPEDWTAPVRARMRRGNRILFAPDDALLADLACRVAAQPRRAQVLWALTLADETAAALAQRYPEQSAPRDAVAATWQWARGGIKMPVAKREILRCHALARVWTDDADIALCHAVGQACGVVHAAGHAMGYPVYDLTALVRRCGADDWRPLVEARVRRYEALVAESASRALRDPGPWAPFLSA